MWHVPNAGAVQSAERSNVELRQHPQSLHARSCAAHTVLLRMKSKRTHHQSSSAGWISPEEKSAGEDEGPVRDRIHPSEHESAQGSVTGPGVNSPKRNGSVIARKLQQKDKLGTRQEQHDEEEYRQPDADQQRKRKSFTNGHVLPVRLHSLRDCRSVGRQASEGYTFWWVSHHSRNIRKAAPRWLYFAFSSALSSANVFRIAGK